MDLGSSSCSPRSSPKVGDRRNIEEDFDACMELGPKRIKMRDLESVLRVEGTKTHNSECRKAKETMDQLCSTDGNGNSKNVEHTESVHSYEQEPSTNGGPATSPPSISAACLSLGHVGSSHSPVSKSGVASSTQKSDVVKPTLAEGIDGNISVKSSRGFDLDLNATDQAGVAYNPFHPYKKLGHAISTDPSECGSTTGPLEESESLRKWKEMKQNGFLSSSHGGIPSVPKQYGRQSKKRKEDERKRKLDATKGETASRFTRIAAPSGLLSGLNPGIINHVRNRKQVHSIIEAMVRSEKSDEQIHNESQERNEEADRKANRFTVPSSRLFSFSVPECGIGTSGLHRAEGRYHHGSVSSQLTSGSEHDNLTLKLSSAGTMASENASCTSPEYISGSQDSGTALSFEAATVASQWLQLLYQDVRGRLAALRRSRKRVRNVIQKELPYLLSAELSSNQDNKPCLWQSIDAGSSNHATSFMHVRKWKSLFSQMDKSLSEEGKHLERVLDQVKGMQMQCEKGLKSVNGDCLPLMGSSHETRLKQEDSLQGEYAVRAAAASIYSTCNLIMTSENVPCF